LKLYLFYDANIAEENSQSTHVSSEPSITNIVNTRYQHLIATAFICDFLKPVLIRFQIEKSKSITQWKKCQ